MNNLYQNLHPAIRGAAHYRNGHDESISLNLHIPRASKLLGLLLIIAVVAIPVVGANDGTSPWFMLYPTSTTNATAGQAYSTSVFLTAADYHSPTLTVTYNYGDNTTGTAMVSGTPWSCTIGDGGCYTYAVPLYHTWTTAGSYTMTITLTDTQSYSASKTFAVSVTNPTCTYGGTYPNCNPPPPPPPSSSSTGGSGGGHGYVV